MLNSPSVGSSALPRAAGFAGLNLVTFHGRGASCRVTVLTRTAAYRGEQTATDLERNLTNLESRLDELLASLGEMEPEANGEEAEQEATQSKNEGSQKPGTGGGGDKAG